MGSDHDHHDSRPWRPQNRSAGLAFVMGLLFGGVALVYAGGVRRGTVPALVTYGLVIASGGILWVPVFLFVAFWSVRLAKFTEGTLAFNGESEILDEFTDDMHETRQTLPASYVRVRS